MKTPPVSPRGTCDSRTELPTSQDAGNRQPPVARLLQPQSPRAADHLLRTHANGGAPCPDAIPLALRFEESGADGSRIGRDSPESDFAQIVDDLEFEELAPGRLLSLMQQARKAQLQQQEAEVAIPDTLKARMAQLLGRVLVPRITPLFEMETFAATELQMAIFHMRHHAGCAQEVICPGVSPGTLPLAVLDFGTLCELASLAAGLGSEGLGVLIAHEMNLLGRDYESALELLSSHPAADLSDETLDRMTLALSRAPNGKMPRDWVLEQQRRRQLTELDQDWARFGQAVDGLADEGSATSLIKGVASAAARLVRCMRRCEQLDVEPSESAAAMALKLASALPDLCPLPTFAVRIESMSQRILLRLATVASGKYAELVALELKRLDVFRHQLNQTLSNAHRMDRSSLRSSLIMAERLGAGDLVRQLRIHAGALERIEPFVARVGEAARLLDDASVDTCHGIAAVARACRDLEAVLLETGRFCAVQSDALTRILRAARSLDLLTLDVSQLNLLQSSFTIVGLNQMAEFDMRRLQDALAELEAEFQQCLLLSGHSCNLLSVLSEQELERVGAAFRRCAPNSALTRAVAREHEDRLELAVTSGAGVGD